MKPHQLALTGTAIAVLASLAGGASPALAASKPSCSAGTTLAVGKSARVFRTRIGHHRRVYGCSVSTKKVSFLGALGIEDAVDTSVLAVNGSRVAYVRTTGCHDQGCWQTVYVRDLKQRKLLSAVTATPGEVDRKQVTDIVLTRSGTVAWIGEAATNGLGFVRFVLVRKPGQPLDQPTLVLSAGLDIVRGSLALAGNTLYWTQGTAKSAPLP